MTITALLQRLSIALIVLTLATFLSASLAGLTDLIPLAQSLAVSAGLFFVLSLLLGHRLSEDSKDLDSGNLSDADSLKSSWQKKRPSDSTIDNLRLELAQAKRSNEVKSTIIANASHELLNPLNSILGFSRLLLDPKSKNDEQTQREYIERVFDSANHLSSLVYDLLAAGDHSVQAIPVRYSTENLRKLLENSIDQYRLDAENKGLIVNTDFGCTDDIVAIVDQTKLRQILSNLISNAIRHTREGNIDVSAEIKQSNEHETLSIAISDTGEGINKQSLAALNDGIPVKKARKRGNKPSNEENHDASTINAKQTHAATIAPRNLRFGIGLSIIQTLCEQLGGTLDIRSELGQGSVFTLTLPLKRASIAEISTYEQSTSTLPTELTVKLRQNLRILIVDDLPSNTMLLRSFCKKLDISCDTFQQGEAAIMALASQRYDLAIVDIRMVPIDGVEVFHAIRRSALNKDIPVIACTAQSQQKEYRELLNLGFNQVLNKPISDNVLRSAIEDNLLLDRDDELDPPTESAIHRQNGPNNPLKNLPFVDYQLALQKASNDEALAFRVLSLFIDELKVYCSLEIATARFDSIHCSGALLESTHRLNGAASVTACTKIYEQIDQLERLLLELTTSTNQKQQSSTDELIDVIEDEKRLLLKMADDLLRQFEEALNT